MIGAVLSARLAKINDLQTVLSIEDLYILTEILVVDNHNRHVARQIAEEQNKNR